MLVIDFKLYSQFCYENLKTFLESRFQNVLRDLKMLLQSNNLIDNVNDNKAISKSIMITTKNKVFYILFSLNRKIVTQQG